MKALKIILTIMMVTLGAQVASAYSIESKGVLFYKKGKEGEIAVRNMTLSVPARGEGKIVLASENSNFDLESEKFFTKDKAGRKVFYVVFEGLRQPGTDGPTTTMVLKGTYLRGSNKALYYGNVFKKKGNLSEFEKKEENLQYLKNFTYSGGFKFEAPVSR